MRPRQIQITIDTDGPAYAGAGFRPELKIVLEKVLEAIMGRTTPGSGDFHTMCEANAKGYRRLWRRTITDSTGADTATIVVRPLVQ